MTQEKKPIKPWQEKKFNPDYKKEEKSEKESIPSNILGTVREEFAREKARAFGKRPTTSPLEEAASEWQKRKEGVIQDWEMGKSVGIIKPWTGERVASFGKKAQELVKEKKPSGPPMKPWEGGRLAPTEKGRLEGMFAAQAAKVKERKEGGKAEPAVQWRQYSPWAEKEKEKGTPRRINMATIHALARKIIAREWRRIRGIPGPDPRVKALEKEIATFEARRLEKKLRKEEEQRKIEEMVKRYQGQLQILVNSLQAPQMLKKMENGAEETLKASLSIESLRSCLEEVGRIETLEEIKENFLAKIEPWHEMKIRMMQLEQIPPQIYEIKINKDFELESFILQDPKAVKEKKVEKRVRVYKAKLEEALGGIQEMNGKGPSFAKAMESKEEERTDLSVEAKEKLELEKKELEKELKPELPDLLRETFDKVGRIVSVSKIDEGWSALVEPWEEMRQRIIEKKEEPFIYNIRVNNNLQLISYLPLGCQAVEKVQSKK